MNKIIKINQIWITFKKFGGFIKGSLLKTSSLTAHYLLFFSVYLFIIFKLFKIMFSITDKTSKIRTSNLQKKNRSPLFPNKCHLLNTHQISAKKKKITLNKVLVNLSLQITDWKKTAIKAICLVATNIIKFTN